MYMLYEREYMYKRQREREMSLSASIEYWIQSIK